MSKQKQYKALIIGAGRIAGTFDTPKSAEFLTHAHAYKAYPKIKLLGFYDIDFKKARQMAAKWAVKAFADLDMAIRENKPDIISICTPDQNHFAQLEKIAGFKNKPKIIICEKPLALAASDVKQIVNLYKKIKIPVLVNYTKRFDQTAQQVAQMIKDRQLGRIIYARSIYGRGLLHSGTHLVDLARYFFGEAKNYKVLLQRNDFSPKDPTIAAFISFKNCQQFYMMAGDCRPYELFEFDIVGEKGRICFTDLSFQYFAQEVVADPFFKGDKILGRPIIKETNFKKAMYNLVDNAVKYLETGEPLISSMADAARTQQICWAIKNNIKLK